jgi:hypothetical protein
MALVNNPATSRRKNTQLQKETAWLMVGAGSLLFAHLVVTASLLSVGTVAIAIAGVGALVWQREFSILMVWISRPRSRQVRRFNQRNYWLSSLLLVVAALFFLTSMATPAQAQFFNTAEQWMTGQFAGADEVIPIVFNVLRGLFLLYLGISLVRVVQAARQDEDWQQLARTPLIILIAVTLGDVLANLIVGGGGA